MKWKILITAPYLYPVINNYKDLLSSNNIEPIILKVKERLSEQELLGLDYIKQIHGIACGDDRITEKVLEKAKSLKVISKWGTGTDSIDKEAAARYGIPVCNTVNAFTDAVADTAMGFILSFARKIPQLDSDMKKGLWQKQKSISLRECVLGIVGIGNIGKAMARRAKAFEMKILGNDIKKIPSDFVKETGLEVVSLENLLKQADFVTIHCDLNPTSHNLINKKSFDLMKATAYLINTARGPIVNEQDLIKALSSKKIAGAALDVFEKEPLPNDSSLRRFSNVLFSPHNANASPLAWERVHKNTLVNIINELSKQKA